MAVVLAGASCRGQPPLVFSQDEPVCIPLYFVSKLARDSGTIVVQVAEGGDEQYAGYRPQMMYLDMYRRFWRPFFRLPGPARGAAAVARGLTGLTDTQDIYFGLVDRAGRGREPFWSGASAYSESRKARLVDRTRLEALTVAPALAGSGLLPEAFGARRQLRDRALVLRADRRPRRAPTCSAA